MFLGPGSISCGDPTLPSQHVDPEAEGWCQRSNPILEGEVEATAGRVGPYRNCLVGPVPPHPPTASSNPVGTGLVPATLSLRPIPHSQAGQELGPPRTEVLPGAVDSAHVHHVHSRTDGQDGWQARPWARVSGQ